MEKIAITQQNYDSIMKNQVEPFLAERRKEGFVAGKDGLQIHYEMYVNPESVGGIVISHGFTESAEKFREVSYRFFAEGYSVFAVDHRGHGLSGRLVEDAYLTHVERFDDYIEDLGCLIDQVVIPNNGGKPLFIYGHSMGGAIAAVFLSRRPEVFKRAILTGPMIQASTPIPRKVALGIGTLMCLFGKGKDRMSGYPEKFDEHEAFETSCDSCFERFEYYRQKRVANRHLQNGAPTFSWVKNAMAVTDDLLDPKHAAKVACPVLLFQGTQDTVVDAEPQNKYISLIRDGRIIRKESKHEIYMATDDVVKTYYEEIFDFLRG